MSREIVLIGRSNVGKSTLFWELTGTKVRVGKRPGITKYPFKAKVGDIFYVDMPGYGFMLKASRADQEKTKDLIVQYFEQNAEEIIMAIQVIDAASFLDIADRWEGRGEVPFEIELWEFLVDMGLDVVLAANKMDRIAKADVDGALDLAVGTAFSSITTAGSKGKFYGQGTYGDVKLCAGFDWAYGSNCGSRGRDAHYYRWYANTRLGARFAAEPL